MKFSDTGQSKSSWDADYQRKPDGLQDEPAQRGGTQPRQNVAKGSAWQKSIQLTFHSMNGLLDILVTVSRLGAKIDYVSARANSAIIVVSANSPVIQRIPSLLRELVEVIELNEL